MCEFVAHVRNSSIGSQRHILPCLLHTRHIVPVFVFVGVESAEAYSEGGEVEGESI